MKKVIKIAALSLLGLSLSVAQADESAIRAALAKSMPSVKVGSVKPSEISGLFEATVGGNIFYVSNDGKYLIQGHLVDVAARTDLTEGKLGGARKQALDKLGQDKMIVFKPKISKYTAEGITIQYLFFPRAGKGSDSYQKAISVWCADDRKAALTSAKKGDTPPVKTCDNPIDEHMQLADDFEVKGTPMIVTEKGNIFPGYLPAKQLAEALEDERSKK